MKLYWAVYKEWDGSYWCSADELFTSMENAEERWKVRVLHNNYMQAHRLSQDSKAILSPVRTLIGVVEANVTYGNGKPYEPPTEN